MGLANIITIVGNDDGAMVGRLIVFCEGKASICCPRSPKFRGESRSSGKRLYCEHAKTIFFSQIMNGTELF